MCEESHNIFTEKRPRRLPLFLPQRLANFLQFIRTVFGLFPYVLTYKNGRLGLSRKHNAVTGTSIDFNDFRMDFVLGLENDPREIGVAAQGVDHDTLYLDVKSIKDVANQFMGQRPFIMLTAHRHGNGAAHARFDVNDKAFFLIPDKNGQRMLIRGKNAKDLNPHDIRVHI